MISKLKKKHYFFQLWNQKSTWNDTQICQIAWLLIDDTIIELQFHALTDLMPLVAWKWNFNPRKSRNVLLFDNKTTFLCDQSIRSIRALKCYSKAILCFHILFQQSSGRTDLSTSSYNFWFLKLEKILLFFQLWNQKPTWNGTQICQSAWLLIDDTVIEL